MRGFFTWAGERAWRALLFAGILLAILSVTGQVYKTDLEVRYPQFLPFLLAASLVLIGVAIILAVREEWFPPPSPNGHPKPKTDIAKSIGVEITQPKFGAKLPPPVTMTGKVKKQPDDEGLQLWLFNLARGDRGPDYYPHGSIVVSKAKTWTTKLTANRYNDGDERNLQLFLVGPDGQKLIAAYRQYNKFYAGDDKPWQPLHNITSDTVPACPIFQILLEKKAVD